jgi:hypothetical protein
VAHSYTSLLETDAIEGLYAAESLAVRWSFAQLLVLGNWLSLHAVLGRGGTGPLLESLVER